MPINTTWSNPTLAGGSGGIDLATGDTLSETVWDRLVSNVFRLGGADGNAKTGGLGVNVSLNSWGANQTPVQIGADSAVWGNSTLSGLGLACNSYYDGTVPRAILTGASTTLTLEPTRIIARAAGSQTTLLPQTFTDLGEWNTAGLFIGDSSNANQGFGLTVNQGTNDNELLALKSSDVAHGMTSITETDTFAKASKHTASGGLLLTGLGPAQVGTQIDGFATTTDTAKSTAAVGAIVLRAGLKSGASVGTFTGTANSNLLVIMDSASTRLACDGEGDLHLDATSNQNVWDEHDDLALLEAYRVTTANPPNYRHRLAEDLEQHKEILHQTGVLTLNEDGHHFVSVKGMFGLLIDAVRQIDARAAARIDALEARLALALIRGAQEEQD